MLGSKTENSNKLRINSVDLSIDDFDRLLHKGAKVELCMDVRERVQKAFNLLEEFTEKKIIYGVNTGFGPMAQHRVDRKDRINLQYNLIRSHSAGAGKAIPIPCVRAGMLARLRNFSLGYSGVHPDVILILKEMINHNIVPVIPEHGGVGASGDLVQLAHLALSIIGEGEVFYQDKRQNTEIVFNELGIAPLKIKLREGLAMINGTSIMSGISVVNILESRKLINWSLLVSAMINEIVQSFDDHYSAELNNVKKHGGQQKIAAAIREITSTSKLVKTREFHAVDQDEVKVFDEKFQEYYSLRCLPQILGPIWDTLKNAQEVIENEVNSVSDNPVIDIESQKVYHGGNFHGDYVSLEMDKLKIAVTKLSMLAERQLNFLMNNKLNNILPPFVNLGVLGVNLGMQGAQFTATSTVAENQTLSNPMYIHSIPNNNDNQDIVSMGTNSALLTRRVIDNTFQVLAIEILSLVQAVDYLNFSDKLSVDSAKLYNDIRALVPKFTEDKIMYKELDLVRDFIKNESPKILK
ncbi:MAG: aromatic amino acid lyase [Bacteroidales bacterium]|nr:aromatic amino acid lyase [Bacteroidales bacterium]